MPRPASKVDLLKAIAREHGALEAALASLSPEQMLRPGVVGEWSAKDVLSHLIEWQQMLLGWYRSGVRGETPAVPAPGFKWNQTPQLNHQIYLKHRERPLAEVLEGFAASHLEVLGLIEDLSDRELFTPSLHAWTGKSTLGTYVVSATSSHYVWARQRIRRAFKAR